MSSDEASSVVTNTSISYDVDPAGIALAGLHAGLEYPEYLALSDEEVPAEEQPLPASFLPTTDSMVYITESDPEEDPGEEDDENPEEDPADYPTDRDEEEEESSGDDADDEEEDKGENGEEDEEYLAPIDSVPSPQTIAATFPLPSPLTPLSLPLPQIPSPPFLVPSPPTTSHTYTEVPLGYRAAGI
ncbi:hypothetical protein Tco_0724318 [Tanacetum coccineum]